MVIILWSMPTTGAMLILSTLPFFIPPPYSSFEVAICDLINLRYQIGTSSFPSLIAQNATSSLFLIFPVEPILSVSRLSIPKSSVAGSASLDLFALDMRLLHCVRNDSAAGCEDKNKK
jgi:hypothetical protein